MNSTKPKNWRTYYSYKPPSLAELGRLTPEMILRQENEYIDWLAARRGIEREDAWALARYANDNRDAVQSDFADRKSEVRQEEHFPNGATVRRVKCFSTGSQKHYGWQAPPYHGEKRLDWHKLPAKPDAPTTYAVVCGGRLVNSFLSRKAARAFAAAL